MKKILSVAISSLFVVGTANAQDDLAIKENARVQHNLNSLGSTGTYKSLLPPRIINSETSKLIEETVQQKPVVNIDVSTSSSNSEKNNKDIKEVKAEVVPEVKSEIQTLQLNENLNRKSNSLGGLENSFKSNLPPRDKNTVEASSGLTNIVTENKIDSKDPISAIANSALVPNKESNSSGFKFSPSKDSQNANNINVVNIDNKVVDKNNISTTEKSPLPSIDKNTKVVGPLPVPEKVAVASNTAPIKKRVIRRNPVKPIVTASNDINLTLIDNKIEMPMDDTFVPVYKYMSSEQVSSDFSSDKSLEKTSFNFSIKDKNDKLIAPYQFNLTEDGNINFYVFSSDLKYFEQLNALSDLETTDYIFETKAQKNCLIAFVTYKLKGDEKETQKFSFVDKKGEASDTLDENCPSPVDVGKNNLEYSNNNNVLGFFPRKFLNTDKNVFEYSLFHEQFGESSLPNVLKTFTFNNNFTQLYKPSFKKSKYAALGMHFSISLPAGNYYFANYYLDKNGDAESFIVKQKIDKDTRK